MEGLAITRLPGLLIARYLGELNRAPSSRGVNTVCERVSALAELPSRDVLLARLAGASRLRIIIKHITPNVVSTFIVLATLDVGIVIILEASLSFLGLGVQPPTASWGSMIADGRGYLETAWWICAFPGLALMCAVLACNLLGDALRDWFNPTMSRAW